MVTMWDLFCKKGYFRRGFSIPLMPTRSVSAFFLDTPRPKVCMHDSIYEFEGCLHISKEGIKSLVLRD